MNSRMIDFQGMVDLDQKVVDQLELYLQEKESRLAHQILNMLNVSNETAPVLPTAGTPLKLSEAVEGFSKQVRLAIQDSNALFSHENAKRVEKEMNAVLWSFTEVLEGCVVELFQQIRQVPINRWHISLSDVVHTVKDILIHRIEDLIWVVRRLDKPLKEYCQKFQSKSQKWKGWSIFGETYLSPDLLRNLQQTEKYLKTRYASFHQRYHEYLSLSSKAEDSLQKMKNYPVLALMEVVDQNTYVDVYRLLKMLEFEPSPKKDIAVDTVRALKHLVSIDSVHNIFRTYLRELKESFFNSSLEWKSLNKEEENFREALKKLQGKVNEYQQELQELIHTISQYRIFILKNDSNPYVRSRWGFTEWIVGPEPVKAKKLLNMVYNAEDLNKCFLEFKESLARDPFSQQQLEYHAHQKIENLLHEIGQPLISHSMMRHRIGNLLEELKACDEIGSPYLSMIYYVEDVLSKVMREDWKYQVLYEFPLFHQIYRIHRGLVEYFEDPAHAFRIERFHHLFHQIDEWVKKEDVHSHVHEIELDMNDMKSYLQDFLASIQRTVKDKSKDPFLDETTHKYRQQLLEYRYLFGQFFSNIIKRNHEGLQLRNQFLFVDQYFESVENLLNELRTTQERRHQE